MSQTFRQLTEHFSRLPGIGPRQATRIVLALLQWPEHQVSNFGLMLADLVKDTALCNECFNLADEAVSCGICSDARRDRSRIAVVEQVTDLLAVEHTGVFRGVYHVLGGSINPSQGNLPQKLKINELVSRIERMRSENPEVTPEVIIATNANTHGDTTALYISEILKPLDINVTKLARGLASGSTLEYADALTLTQALKHRR